MQTMKRISNLLVLLICFSTSIYGQAEKVRRAEESLKSQRYQQALELIEEAVKHPKP